MPTMQEKSNQLTLMFTQLLTITILNPKTNNHEINRTNRNNKKRFISILRC
jgi:hypothetical protein